MIKRTDILRIATNSPDDVSGVEDAIASGALNPNNIVAIIGKTEGNGCVNDFTRGFSSKLLAQLIGRHTGKSEHDVVKQVALVMSGGTEGVLSPHLTIFSVSETHEEPKPHKRLAVASGYTRNFLPEEQGTMAMVIEVKNVVLQLMKDAGIQSSNDIHFVQIKCPLLTSDRIIDAERRVKKVVTHDTYSSMGYNRGASALGVAIALGEVDEKSVSDESICSDWSLYSGVASTSAGVELLNCEIFIMGNADGWGGECVIGHSVMKSAIDADAVYEAFGNAKGQVVNGRLTDEDKSQIVNVFAKAEAHSKDTVCGRRTTMHTDSDINHTRHARAAVGGVISSIVSDPMIYVSGGAEHQGPDGGGPVAVILKCSE